MKKLLYIAYHFPPYGGAGVQRSLKFVKYLPSYGISPTVLTSSSPPDQKWSPADTTLAHEIPPEIPVLRTVWPNPSQPGHHGVEEHRHQFAARLIKERRLEAIFVSMSPFTDAAFAARLSAHCGIPWIADLRDPWALDEFQVYRTRWHRHAALRQMRAALQSASLIVMNTPDAAQAICKTFPEFAEGRVISITNGYDAEDFASAPDEPNNERFTIVHTGFLHTAAGLRQKNQAAQYRLLGRLSSGVELLPRSHFYLLQALAQWHADVPDLPCHLHLQLVGEPRPADRDLVAKSSVASLVSFTGYLSHRDSLRAMSQADLLFLPMHKMPCGRRASIVPGKTYEYLASGRPILAAVPLGDARDFLTEARTGLLCRPDDVGEMLRLVLSQFESWKARHPSRPANTAFVQRFERRELTRQLAAELHAAIDRHNGVRPSLQTAAFT